MLKEIKLSPNIAKHDVEYRVKQAREFIKKGNQVKITLRFKGREIAHPSIGEEKVVDFIRSLLDIAKQATPIRVNGRLIMVTMEPKGNNKDG